MSKVACPIRLGYCCVNLSLGEKFKTMQLGWALKNPTLVKQKWEAVVSHNFELLAKIFEWNIKEGIWLYRVTGEIVPFADHRELSGMWQNLLDSKKMRAKTGLATLADVSRRYIEMGGRITTHPAQYVSLGSSSPETRKNSRLNLEYHSVLMAELGTPPTWEHPINIHISNGSKGEAVVDLVKESLTKLSDDCRSRLVFENEQSGFWTVGNIHKFFPEIPITIDYHHHRINPTKGMSSQKVEKIVRGSWRGIRPVCHWSEGRDHPYDPAHSEYITRLPKTSFDIEVEAKAKDWAILPFLPIPRVSSRPPR